MCDVCGWSWDSRSHTALTVNASKTVSLCFLSLAYSPWFAVQCRNSFVICALHVLIFVFSVWNTKDSWLADSYIYYRLHCNVWYKIWPTVTPVLFLWRYEPVRRTGKSDDWLTIFFCSHNKVHCSQIPIKLWRWIGEWTDRVLHSILLHFASELKWSRKMRLLSVFYFSFEISVACWLLSRPNWRIVSKLTTDVVTYCTEASNQKSKYAYRKIFFYKKALCYTFRQ